MEMANTEDEMSYTTIEWRIKSIHEATEKPCHFSKIFSAFNLNWRLAIKREKEQLHVYVILERSRLPKDYSVNVTLKFIVLNQLDPSKSIQASLEHNFIPGSNTCGLWTELARIENERSGFMLNDLMAVKVHLYEFSSSHPTPCLSYEEVCFRGMAFIDKELVTFLDHVYVSRPALIDCLTDATRNFREWTLSILGLLLKFLETTKWEAMDSENCAQLRYLWSELSQTGLNMKWLENRVESALSMESHLKNLKTLETASVELERVDKEWELLRQELSDLQAKVFRKKKELAEKGVKRKRCRSNLSRAKKAFIGITMDIDLNGFIGYKDL